MFTVKDAQNGGQKQVSPSKAKVIDSRDPLKRGRIRVLHPIIGESVWIDYVGEPNAFNPPKIGDLVYIEADSGWATHPIARGKVVKGSDTSPEIPQAFRRDVPTNRGMYTPGGHLVELDDGEAPVTDAVQDTNFTTKNRGIRVTSRAGNKVHIIEDVDSGDTYILIQDAGGNLIKLDYKNNQLTINSIGKTKIDTAEDKTETVGGNESQTVTGNRTKNVNGNETDTIGGNLQITITGSCDILATGATTVKGSNITLKSPANSINGGVVTDNTVNNDPITGIPLTPVGGVVTSS